MEMANIYTYNLNRHNSNSLIFKNGLIKHNIHNIKIRYKEEIREEEQEYITRLPHHYRHYINFLLEFTTRGMRQSTRKQSKWKNCAMRMRSARRRSRNTCRVCMYVRCFCLRQ